MLATVFRLVPTLIRFGLAIALICASLQLIALLLHLVFPLTIALAVLWSLGVVLAGRRDALCGIAFFWAMLLTGMGASEMLHALAAAHAANVAIVSISQTLAPVTWWGGILLAVVLFRRASGSYVFGAQAPANNVVEVAWCLVPFSGSIDRWRGGMTSGDIAARRRKGAAR
ncbi:MAG: hypothetical protein WAN59_00185 [Candidatus Baltobacteraceae bacterium]